MRIHLLIICFGALLALASCKKEKVDILETNTPVFHLSGEWNEESIELIAGDEGVFMYTFTGTENGVDLFSGSLGTSNEYVELSIYNGNIDVNELLIEDVLGSFTPGFAGVDQIEYEVNADDFIQSAFVDEVKWYLNGAFKGTDSFIITEPGKYEICGEVTYSDQSVDTLCNEIIVGYAVHAHSNASLNSQLGYIQANIQATSVAINKVNWFLEGQAIGSGNYLNHYIGDETKHLTAEITYANGITRTKSFLVNGYQANRNVLDFSSLENQNSGYYQDYRIVISYMKGGIEYRTDLADNSSSIININGFEFFGENESGKDVYKLNVSISAKVASFGSTTEYPINFNAVFGIEIE